MTWQGCSLRAHLECYFTKGTRDANDTITDMEQWCCEMCHGLPRHIHPRPVEAKRQRVTWTQPLALPSNMLASTGGFRGGGLSAAKINIDSGKGKEPMILDDADSRLDHVDMTTDESALDNMNPSKRQRTAQFTIAQFKSLEAADEEEEIGLNIFDSRDLTAEHLGTPASATQTPQGRVRGTKKRKKLIADGQSCCNT